MKVGYARVSTSDQNIIMQEDSLKDEGCDEVFKDVACAWRKCVKKSYESNS